MPGKKDIFYFAVLWGIPVYYQPLTHEIIPRNKFYGFLLDYIVIPLHIYLGYEIELVIKHKIIKRQEITK